MSSAPGEEFCSGSRGRAADVSDDRETGVCPVCGRTVRLGYGLLLLAHAPLRKRLPGFTLGKGFGFDPDR